METMSWTKGAWCDHMFLSDKKDEWAYGKSLVNCEECPASQWIVLQAQDDWLYCPRCGSPRPKGM